MCAVLTVGILLLSAANRIDNYVQLFFCWRGDPRRMRKHVRFLNGCNRRRLFPFTFVCTAHTHARSHSFCLCLKPSRIPRTQTTTASSSGPFRSSGFRNSVVISMGSHAHRGDGRCRRLRCGARMQCAYRREREQKQNKPLVHKKAHKQQHSITTTARSSNGSLPPILAGCIYNTIQLQ